MASRSWAAEPASKDIRTREVRSLISGTMARFPVLRFLGSCSWGVSLLRPLTSSWCDSAPTKAMTWLGFPCVRGREGDCGAVVTQSERVRDDAPWS
jgi:hypothetical protein